VPKVRLTDITIKNLKPPAKGQVDYWCDHLPTFGVRVSQGGSRSFILKKENSRQVIGRWPLVSLQQARSEARRRLAEMTLGFVEPVQTSFDEALEIYIEQYVPRLRKSTAYEKERILRRNVRPHLQGKSLQAITPRDISSVTDGLSSIPTTAVHVHQAMRAFFRWCVARHMLARSPCENLPLPARIQSRSRVLAPREMAAIYKAAVSYGYPFGHIVRILLLVPLRRSEAASLRSEYLVGDTIELPGMVTKNHQPLSLPVCPMLGAVLQSVPRIGSGFLFPSRHDDARPFSGFSKCKARLDELSGVSDYTLHDCRRSISTMLAKPPISTPPHVIDTLLNHVTGHATISEVAAIYNRYRYQAEARSAMLTYETTFSRLLEHE